MANLLVQLPKAEQKLFNTLSKHFDDHQYAKGVKVADQILALFPDHGETMAMKGLCLHTDGQKEGEDGGIAWIKKGISKCMRAVICWHSLGMCHRADREWTESMKAFKMAHRMDPKNGNVLRDIASLAIQIRDWDTFLDAREKMLNIKSNIRQNWLAVSAGHRMKKQYDLAGAIAEIMVMMLDAGDHPAEISEVHLYRAELELLANRPHKALEILKKNDKQIPDPTAKLTVKGKALSMQGGSQKQAAENAYMELISMGYAECDNLFNIAKVRGVAFHPARTGVPADEESQKKFIDLLDTVVAKHPRCDAAKRLALDACTIEEFEKRLVAYATPFVVKNIPSLSSVLKSLYVDAERVEIIGKLFTRWETELKAGDFKTSFSDVADPTYILWVYMFLSTHNLRQKKFEEAHKYIDLAINHTPTVEMLYLHRAKIFHREGKVEEAAEAADMARLLDLQDKYLNGKAAKYFFRAGKLEEAEERMGLFYKATTVNDHFLTARDSQCAWYEKECGDCEFNRGDVYAALQNYLLYEKHHQDNHDTLIDFHNYTFRKGNVRSWVDLIESDDNFEARKLFLSVAPSIVRAFMKVEELGAEAVKAAHKPRPDIENTGNEEEDKVRNERKKDFILDVDLSEPMQKAHRYMSALLTHRGKNLETHKQAIELYTAWNKPVFVVRSLNALVKLGFKDEAKTFGAEFKKNAKKDAWAPAVAAIVEETLKNVGA